MERAALFFSGLLLLSACGNEATTNGTPTPTPTPTEFAAFLECTQTSDCVVVEGACCNCTAIRGDRIDDWPPIEIIGCDVECVTPPDCSALSPICVAGECEVSEYL